MAAPPPNAGQYNPATGQVTQTALPPGWVYNSSTGQYFNPTTGSWTTSSPQQVAAAVAAQTPTPAAPAAPAAPAGPVTANPGNYTAPFQTSTIGYGMNPSGGPSITGNGLFEAQPYAINDEAITGNPTQGAAEDYGLNSVWNNLDNALQANQVNNYSASAPTTTAAQAAYAMANPTQISTAGALPLQQQQASLAGTLDTQATGGGVSPADLQLAQGSQENLAAQLSALGSQRGGGSGNPALAARMAADTAAASGANLNTQMGIQRAQETLQAQQAENSVLSSGVGEAQSYNTQQADLSQANQEYNAGNAQATQIANLGANQQTNLANENAVAAQTLANQQAAEQAQTQYNQQLLALSGAQTGIGESQQSAALANQQLQVNQQENVNQVNEAGYGNAAQANANLFGTAAGALGTVGGIATNLLKTGSGSGTTSTTDPTPSGSAAATYNPNQPNGFDPGTDTGTDATSAATSAATDTGSDWADADATFSNVPDVGDSGTLNAQNFYGTSSPTAATSPTGGPAPASGALAGYRAQSPPASQASGPSQASSFPGTSTPYTPPSGTSPAFTSQPQSTQSFQYPAQNFPGTSGPSYPSGNAYAPSPFQNYGQPMPGYGGGPTFGGTSSAGGFPGSNGGAQQTQTGGAVAPISTQGIMGPGTYVGANGYVLNANGLVDNSQNGPGTAGYVATGGAPATAPAINLVAGSSPTQGAGASNPVNASTDQTSTALPFGAQNLNNPVVGAITGLGAAPASPVTNIIESTAPTTGASAGTASNAGIANQSVGAFYGEGVSQNKNNPVAGAITGNGAAPSSPVTSIIAGGNNPIAAAASATPFSAFTSQNLPTSTSIGAPVASGLTAGGTTSALAGQTFIGAPASSSSKPPTTILTTKSDENVKTGIEGGNPMLQSFLDQYNQDKHAADPTLATPDYQGPRAGIRGASTTTGNVPTAGAPILGALGTAFGSIFGVGALGGALGSALGTGLDQATTDTVTTPGKLYDNQAASGFTSQNVAPEQDSLYGSTSDENAKTDIHDPDEDDVQAFLDSVHAHSYRYKNPSAPGAGYGTYVSPMAQEIEKTDLGKNFVFQQPDGTKGVDYGKAFGTLMASQAMVNERLNDHEMMLRSMGRR